MLWKSIASHEFIPNHPDNKMNEAKSLAMIAECHAMQGDYEAAVEQMLQTIQVSPPLGFT